jgi:hypothetical protein
MALQKLISPKQARQLTQQDSRIEVIETSQRELTTRSEFVDVIGRAWSGAQKRFLMIGRYLIQAKARLPHGDYIDMIERDLPFRRNIAFQLREVAEAIDSGRVAEHEVPPNYSVIYQLVTLSDAELHAARERGMVRPNVTRREIEVFKRSVRTPQRETREELYRRRQRLLAEQERILAELRQIEQELGNRFEDDAVIEGAAVEVTVESGPV